MFKTIVKVAAIGTLLGVCCSLPVDDTNVVEVAPSSALVLLEPEPAKVEDLPKPPNPDDSDLKTDATSWWHSWYYYNKPAVVYYRKSVPVHRTYWKTYY